MHRLTGNQLTLLTKSLVIMGDVITILQILVKLNNQHLVEDQVIEELADKLDKKIQIHLGPLAYALLRDKLNQGDPSELIQ